MKLLGQHGEVKKIWSAFIAEKGNGHITIYKIEGDIYSLVSQELGL